MEQFRAYIRSALLIFVASSLWAAGPHPEAGRPFPTAKIPPHARGPQIIQALGGDLPDVARWYGSSADEFRAAVGHDHSVHSDADGLLYYVCEGAEASETSGDSLSTLELAAGTDAFALHSRPGAPLVIHLDFDGHVTRGTNWNSAYNGGADFVTPPYDTDGNTGSFSSGERANIVAIWARVAEDFAPWDVDVTTEDPGASALQRSSGSDTDYGIRVCIGGSSYDWFGAGAGGVAYIGSFTWSQDTPCYVFEAQLGNGNVKYTAEAVSHEVGHTFALYHDGINGGTAYYQGHADWAPIMGVGYYKAVTQWSRGDYANANNLQDDLAIITDRLPLRPDLVGDDISTPIAMIPGALSGVIETRDDADLYRFESAGGLVEFSATNFGNQPNLDILLALYDGGGNPIVASNPSGLTASLSATVAPGTYFIGVEGVGTGDPATAYDDYGSLGEFHLSGAFSASGNLAPVADVTGSGPLSGRAPLTVSFSSADSYDADGSIVAYDWEFGDGGISSDLNPIYTFTTPGTYTTSLLVLDNEGASGSDTVTIVVEAPQPPVARISTSGSLSGFAPLTVTFDGGGSSDADGSIVSHAWSFGDGTNASGVVQTHTFGPGSFTVTLTVTDNEGLTDTDAVVVSAQDPADLPALIIGNMTISVSGNSRKGYQASVEVSVVDERGRGVQNALVSGEWSGVVSGFDTRTTSRKGSAPFRSDKVRSSGPVTFVVTDIVLSGYLYDEAAGDGPSVSATIP